MDFLVGSQMPPIRAAKSDVQRLLPRAKITLMQGASKITGWGRAYCFKTKILSSPQRLLGPQSAVPNVTSKCSNASSPLLLLLPLSPLPSSSFLSAYSSYEDQIFNTVITVLWFRFTTIFIAGRALQSPSFASPTPLSLK